MASASKKKPLDLGYLIWQKSQLMSNLKAARVSANSRSVIVKAMAHPTRLLVLDALTQGEKCVNELTSLAGCDVTTLSKHLSLMKRSGLLQCDKRGVHVFYQIACPCFLEFFRCIDLIQTNQALQKRCVTC